nr:retrovirus-related Pol polyprotein from transposon TNT 1-94 [Tanacetum cinerariifolium]
AGEVKDGMDKEGIVRIRIVFKTEASSAREDSGLEFDEKRGAIFNSNKEIVMIALRVRDVYVLDMTSSAQESCFFAKATKNLNWLWHKILAHLNFKTINQLAKQNLVIDTNMKESAKYIGWDKVKITDEVIEYVMPKYGKTNWMKDNSWSEIILNSIYNTFYKDEAHEDKENRLQKKGKGKEAEHDHLKVNKDDKGNGNEKLHDLQNIVEKLEVYLVRALKAKQAEHDKGKAKQAEHDLDDVHLDALDLENRVKRLEEDFGRMLKAKMTKEAKETELKVNKEVVQVSPSDEGVLVMKI